MRRTLLAAAVATLMASQAYAQESSATAKMAGADGSDNGSVTFNQTKSGMLHIIVEMTNLAPGSHGLHIHEKGACDAAGGFESAGGHYAGGKEHGVNSENGPHAGDLPNVHVGGNGVLKVELFTDRLSLGEGGVNTLMDADGSAVVLHAEPDDHASAPAGHAGNRVACGVIEQPS